MSRKEAPLEVAVLIALEDIKVLNLHEGGVLEFSPIKKIENSLIF